MPLTAGLSPSIRQEPEAPPPLFDNGSDVIVEHDDGADAPALDDKGNILSIEHPDGSITISLDGSPLARADEPDDNPSWFDNLVDKIDAMDLGLIANDLLRGVDEDIQSRQDWIDQRSRGMMMLGLKLEQPGLTGSGEGAPVEGMSKVRHPLLLEAVLRFQANARSELLPTDGPVKTRVDSNNGNEVQDDTANALEKDMNHYLTVTATEYYPDTDRMLLMLGFGGTAFKKVYFCPLRNRPVSETVDANDLIVNNSATDLRNAKRVTHRIMMRPSTVKRMQILGAYREIDLNTPNEPQLNQVDLEKKAQQGISPTTSNPEDRDREIYEIYCELDLKGFEHRHKGKDSGLEIPYRVTIDVSTREILSVVRNYDEADKKLPTAKVAFVKYTFVPGFGFYDIGLLNILGNTTSAITAAWRELLDAGMFSNFPGFLQVDSGLRQDTNIFRVPPGGGATIRTNGLGIRDAVMPLPYNPPQPAFMQLVENIVETGQRIGGTAELQVGEGNQDAPVGTTLALIEQATKVLNSVHKRMHAAQAEEFQLLADCFKENPESFWQKNRTPTLPWDEKTFLRALDDVNIIPQADPNTASHTQRLMKVAALKQLQAASPQLYDPIAIDRAALKAIGWNNPEQFMAPVPTANQPTPEEQAAQAMLAIKDKEADAKMLTAQAKAQELQAKSAAPPGQEGPDQIDNVVKLKGLALKERQIDFQQGRAKVEDHNRDQDRAADLAMARMKLQGDVIDAAADRAHERDMQGREQVHDHISQARDLAHTVLAQTMDHQHQRQVAKEKPKGKPHEG